MRTNFINTKFELKPASNQVRSLNGDCYVVVDEPCNPFQGLLYQDFSVNSLLASGATDLLSGHHMLNGDNFTTHDLINVLDKSPIIEDSKIKSSKEKLNSSSTINQSSDNDKPQ